MRDSAEQFSRLRDAVTAAVSTLERALQPPADVPMGDIPDLDVLREAETLVLHALGMPRSTLYAVPDRLLSE